MKSKHEKSIFRLEVFIKKPKTSENGSLHQKFMPTTLIIVTRKNVIYNIYKKLQQIIIKLLCNVPMRSFSHKRFSSYYDDNLPREVRDKAIIKFFAYKTYFSRL